MDQRASFLIELLDKLGVPLMNAVQTEAVQAGGDTNPARQAELLATMLSQSVQLGVGLAGKLDLKEGEGDADAVRLSLSAMAGKLIGDSYRLHGRLPTDDDKARMTRALEAVLTFADNFTPSAEHSARLRAVGGEKPLFDLNQSQIFYLSAMEPVLGAIAEFPFGQNEITLIQQTADKLHERAKTLREALIGVSAEGPESAFAELMALHSLARIYADCHRAETARVANAGENDSPPSLDPVWKGFDLRLSMLEALLSGAVPGAAPENVAPPAPAQPQQTQAETAAPPQQIDQSEAPPAPETPAQPVQAPPPETPQAPPPPAGGAPGGMPGSPMGFFAQKPAGGDQAPQQPPAQPPQQPPAAPEAPPAPPPPPAEQTPQQPPSAPPSDGSPMSFFKPGAKKANETGGHQGE